MSWQLLLIDHILKGIHQQPGTPATDELYCTTTIKWCVFFCQFVDLGATFIMFFFWVFLLSKPLENSEAKGSKSADFGGMFRPEDSEWVTLMLAVVRNLAVPWWPGGDSPFHRDLFGDGENVTLKKGVKKSDFHGLGMKFRSRLGHHPEFFLVFEECFFCFTDYTMIKSPSNHHLEGFVF